MIFFHLGQALIAVAVGVILFGRIREVLYRGSLERVPFVAAVRVVLAEGDQDRALALVRAAEPAFVARGARALLDPDASEPVDECLAELHYEAQRHLGTLRVLARVATASGLLGAIVELLWLVYGDHGILPLQAGLVETMALEGGILAIVLGAATSGVAFYGLSIVKRRASALLRDVALAVDSLEASLASVRTSVGGWPGTTAL
jgi:hypothetical protein